MTSYTVSGVLGVTYYITVIAVNAVGPGPISGYSIAAGDLSKINYELVISCCFSQ